jgi:hypothetical protein
LMKEIWYCASRDGWPHLKVKSSEFTIWALCTSRYSSSHFSWK